MNTNNKFLKSTLVVAAVTIVLLMAPFITMQLSNEVDWNLFDFIVAGFLLFGTGFTFVLLTIKANNLTYKAGIAVGLFAGLFLIWANLAVGIIGSEDNPINVVYFGVIFLGAIGATIARFRPRGLSTTLFAMAILMGLIYVVLLSYGLIQGLDLTFTDVASLFAIHGLFITLFTISAILLRRTANNSSI